MDKETLSNYGWIVICVLVLAIMIALATPFGSYVADGFKAAYNGFGDTNTEVTDMMYSAVGTKVPASCGIEGHYKGDNRGTHGIPSTDCPNGHKYTCECVSLVVPADGTYTMITAVNGKSVYNAGEALPNHYIPQTGDTYEEGDYKYTYKNSSNGWSVTVKDKSKSSYGEIISEIAGKPVTYMGYTFSGCSSLITAPAIPNGVTDMNNAFKGCTSLATAPTIPNSVTNMVNTFLNCISLVTAPVIPSSVTDMYGTFSSCISLATAPTIPNSVTRMSSTFSNCSSLVTAPVIPSSVTDMSNTFSNCISLVTAPVIPSSVTIMTGTFFNCKVMTGTVEINANPTKYSGCLKSTKITEVAGFTTLKAEILATK